MTQNDKLMEALMAGRILTPLNALIIAQTLRLSQRIIELEAQGVPIVREWQKVGKKRVMSYRLGIAYG